MAWKSISWETENRRHRWEGTSFAVGSESEFMRLNKSLPMVRIHDIGSLGREKVKKIWSFQKIQFQIARTLGISIAIALDIKNCLTFEGNFWDLKRLMTLLTCLFICLKCLIWIILYGGWNTHVFASDSGTMLVQSSR